MTHDSWLCEGEALPRSRSRLVGMSKPAPPPPLCVSVCVQVRVYTKKTGAKPDFDSPVVLTSDRGGTLIESFCRQIHNTLLAVRQGQGAGWGGPGA